MKICSVTVLYHPDESVVENINSYYGEVDRLFIVDNTENKEAHFLNKNTGSWDAGKIVYLANSDNKGIAYALNQACQLAYDQGFEWILTMDQDSAILPGFFQYSRPLMLQNSIGIIAASFSQKFPFAKYHSEFSNEYVFVITSGNLLRLSAWKECRFEEKLFIDEVDNDFCLRLKKQGYIIIGSKAVFLRHALGETKTVNIFGRQFSVGVHSPIRTYYITRNILYIINKNLFSNLTFCLNRLKALCLKTVLITFFYPQKRKHFSYHIKGLADFFRSRYGKLKLN